MEPREIAKLLTSLDFNNGVIIEQTTIPEIPEGDGPFIIHFNRGTTSKVDHIARSERDPNLFYAGIGEGFCFKTRGRNVPLAMVMLDDRNEARELFGIDVPRKKYMAAFAHIITFNPKNVLKVERI
jgi:hypothetical protein